MTGGTSERRVVYVVDDEAGVRIAVADVVEGIGYEAHAFTNGAELLRAVGASEPGCILLDIQMPGLSGLDILADLARLECDWPVIAMTAHGDVPTAVQAMKAGAFDFLEKPFDTAKLEPLIGKAIDGWEAERGQRQSVESARRRIKALTPREQEVLRELGEGKQNKVIAFDLGLSVRTVEMHRARMLDKLGLGTVQEAVALLIWSDLSPP